MYRRKRVERRSDVGRGKKVMMMMMIIIIITIIIIIIIIIITLLERSKTEVEFNGRRGKV